MPPRKTAAARKVAPKAVPKAVPKERKAAPVPDAARPLAMLAVEAGLDKKAERPTVLDVRGLSSYADYVVLLSADNRRQIDAVATEIEARLRQAGVRALGAEGNGDSGWMLLDFADVVVHLFSPEARDFYDLEGLWSDAPRVRV
ncbi:MAG TPA: ribosome silencing factor [Myxococcales bacterium]|nr:ribosome silencing factor [Myxococcales bacterium]